MFGRKKDITQKFIEKADKQENIIKDDTKKERTDSDDNFIFYGSNKKFSKQLEIYATLKDPQEKIQKDKLVMIVIDSTLSIEYLSLKICESFSQYPEYHNLEGLRAINLTKINDEKNLPLEGKVEDLLRNGDIIYLDLIANELWIKVVINMTSVINKNFKLIVGMDVKIKNDVTFKQLRYKLIKSGIMCFLDKKNKSINQYHYVVSDLTISTSTHGNLDENKLKSIDNMTVKQLFNFKSNVKLDIKFFPLEFILFQKLKILSIPKSDENKKASFYWQNFKEMRFRELLNIKKYSKEKKYIFNFFKNLFKSDNNNILEKFYVYSLEEDINKNISDESHEKLPAVNIINNSELKDTDEFETLKIERTGSALFNWTDIGRTSSYFNLSGITDENEKLTLIILPPQKEEKDELLIKSNLNKKKRSKKRKKTDQNLNLNFSGMEIGIIKEENEDEGIDDFFSKKPKLGARKISDYDLNESTLKFGNKYDFEIIDNKELEQDDDNIFKNIIQKGSDKRVIKDKKNLSDKKLLIDKFDKYFEKDKFLEFLSGLYLINIERGALERSTIPIFRNLKIDEKKISKMNKRRKKKKYVDYSLIYQTIFSVKRLNIELGIFSVFVIAIFIFFAYLLGDTFY